MVHLSCQSYQFGKNQFALDNAPIIDGHHIGHYHLAWIDPSLHALLNLPAIYRHANPPIMSRVMFDSSLNLSDDGENLVSQLSDSPDTLTLPSVLSRKQLVVDDSFPFPSECTI